MDVALQRIDERNKVSQADKALEKRIEQQKSDLREAILFAGYKNAKLATAQDTMLHLSAVLNQFYNELTDKDSQLDVGGQVAKIMQNLKIIAETNADADTR